MTDAFTPLPGWRGGDGNAAYLDKTLRHEPMAIYLDESVNWRTLLSLWLRAAVVAFAFWFFFFLLWIFTGGLSALFSNTVGYAPDGSGAGSASPALFAVGEIGSFVLFWLIFLFSKRDEPIGEWCVLLADRAPVAESAYSCIVGRLRDRRLPIAAYTRRTRTEVGSVGHRLVLLEGHYEAHVSVFGYGTSLYLGWMMWRSRRGVTLVGRFVVDLLVGLMGRRDPVELMLRTERPRAMREAVHAVCREGLHVAVEGIEVPNNYGFPRGLPPIETYPGTSAPAPGMAPAPAGAPAPGGAPVPGSAAGPQAPWAQPTTDQ